MTIEQPKVIDFISINASTGEVVLSISDHLAWDGVGDHLLLLQEKINNYLAFVESGEILQSYPKAKGRPVLIDVVCEHPLNDDAIEFFGKATSIVRDAGFRLTYRIMETGPGSN